MFALLQAQLFVGRARNVHRVPMAWQVRWFLKELGVKAITEMQFYSEFLLPDLATNLARTSTGELNRQP